MTKLRATGLWDRALIVLAADHGVAFAPNSPRRKITTQDVGGIAPVPFFMKLPRETRGRILDKHVQTSDILPSIADALDFQLPEKSDGHSALSSDFRPSPEVRVWSTTSTKEFKLVSVPFPVFLTRRGAVAAQQAALFGTGSVRPGLIWAVGPDRELVGRPLAAAPLAGTLPASVRYDHPEELENWTPAAPWAPSHVSGVIDGLGPGRNLALAVGGRIQAVARTYDYLGKTRFSFMAPETAFRVGANDVRVFAVTGSGRGVRLAALGA
jgi:hypothetical protein